MPAARVFIDSNVLLYTRDEDLSEKATAASRWLREAVLRNLACANLQVLNEVTHVMLRKRRDLRAEQIFEAVDDLQFLGVSPIDGRVAMRARGIRLKTAYSWWDCLLLASALELGCSHFLSEDLQDGQRIEYEAGKGLTIIDPFAHTPEQILVSP